MTGDILIPDFDSSQRKSVLVAATFNLSATIIGGGALSLPLAFEKCGVVLGTVLMIIAGIVTERSLYLLCLCARITGATSYGEVGKVAFGKYMEYLISMLLFVFLMFVLVAYMVLVQDIWSSIVEIIGNFDHVNGNWLLLLILLIMYPFLMQKTLHALRFNCYIGFVSVSILCLALCHHAITTPLPKPLVLWTTSIHDILFAFPIITLSFLSIFNVLPIQGSLIRPTRGRILVVIDGAMGSSFVLMLLFGISGYLYAGANTDGNILNNCDHHSDWMFFLGRLGCGITIMLAMAMMLLPCRESLLEVIDVFVNGPHVLPLEEEIPLLVVPSQGNNINNNDNKKEEQIFHRKSNHQQSSSSSFMRNPIIDQIVTFGITATCYLIAVHVPGVAIVWSLCGSFMAFLIAFILPAACYIRIQHEYPSKKENKGWIWFSWGLLVTSILAAIACTLQTISGFVFVG